MAVFEASQNRVHSLGGNHLAGIATASRGAASVEMWRGTMDAGAATPPHQHDHEEVVLFLRGSGRATIGGAEVRYEAGDTLILPPRTVHQIFAESDTELVAAMPLGDPIRDPSGEPMELPWRS